MVGLRQRALRALVVVAALWPLLHMGLALEYGLSSWKLAGWGMYATPPPSLYFSWRVQRGASDEWRRVTLAELLEHENAPRPRVFRARRWLGSLVSADTVARGVLERVPDGRALELTIETRTIESATGRVVLSHEHGRATRAPH